MAKQRKRLLIVDGFNVLRSSARYQRAQYEGPNPDYDSDSFNRAREALINDVASYAGKDADAIIVFDGAGNQFSDGSVERIGGVRVIFSPAGTSADKLIEKYSRQARDRGIETMVVSSDATIQNTVFGLGVDRMSANGFGHAIDMNDRDYELDLSPQVAVKNTVGERLDASTLQKLKALRDQMGSQR